MPNVLEVGKKLVDLCRKQKNLEAIDTLYAQNIVSVEPFTMGDMPQTQEGIKAIRGKHEWWYATHTIHSGKATGPWPHGDRFIVHFKYDVTSKEGPMAGKRMTIDETGLYTVKDGKIVKEEFFYAME